MASTSQESAQKLLRGGATLIFLDFPSGSEFGIDYNTWNTGEKFKGVKMIPPGIHFVHYSAVNLLDSAVAPKTGFFQHFKSGEVVVKKWNAKTEEINDVDQSQFEEVKLTVMDMDSFLGAYPYENFKKWVSMTDYITVETLQKIVPLCGKIASATQLVNDDETTTTSDRNLLSHKREQEKLKSGRSSSMEGFLPSMHLKPGTELRFSAIPKQKYPSGASPMEVTKYSMDSSYVLTELIKSSPKSEPTQLLGELQMAFVCFLVGQVYDAFEQWKKLVHILCTSEEALVIYPELFSSFIHVLHFQLKEIPSDFFVDIVSQNNFLTSTLKVFFENLQASETDSGLKQRGKRFKHSLVKKFRWDFDADPDDEAPVVVQL